MNALSDEDLAATIGRATERYLRTHRQGSMATISALILFDALRQDILTSGRRSVTSFSRPQLRGLMAAHPAWEGKAFEETSFNTVPEDLGDQLEQFLHDDFVSGAAWKFRFRGPTRKFRNDKTSRELFLEYEAESAEAAEVAAPLAVNEPPRSASRTRWITAALVVAAVLVVLTFLLRPKRPRADRVNGPAAIAVLPFHVIGGDPQLEFLGVGLADAIITRLAMQRQIRVRPTMSILRYQGEKIDIGAAASELDADYVLTGTLQSIGGRLRASVQLVGRDELSPVWARPFDVARDDLLVLEDTIADNVVQSLALRIAALPAGATTTPAAFELYLQGRAALMVSTPEEFRRALALFDQAARLDPKFARAHAGVAFAAANLHYFALGTPEAEVWQRRGEQSAAMAVSLGPDLAETHEALAKVYSAAAFEWEKAVAEARRALELNPGLFLARITLVDSYSHLGLIAVARRELALASETNPGAPADDTLNQATLELFAGDFQSARRELERTVQLGVPLDRPWIAPLVLFLTGDEARALQLLARTRDGFRGSRARAIEASIHAAGGRHAEAEKSIAAVFAAGYFDHHVSYHLGVAYAQLGKVTEASSYLRQAMDTGFPCYPLFKADPLLAGYRASAEGSLVLAELQQRWAEVRKRYGDL